MTGIIHAPANTDEALSQFFTPNNRCIRWRKRNVRYFLSEERKDYIDSFSHKTIQVRSSENHYHITVAHEGVSEHQAHESVKVSYAIAVAISRHLITPCRKRKEFDIMTDWKTQAGDAALERANTLGYTVLHGSNVYCTGITAPSDQTSVGKTIAQITGKDELSDTKYKLVTSNTEDPATIGRKLIEPSITPEAVDDAEFHLVNAMLHCFKTNSVDAPPLTAERMVSVVENHNTNAGYTGGNPNTGRVTGELREFYHLYPQFLEHNHDLEQFSISPFTVTMKHEVIKRTKVNNDGEEVEKPGRLIIVRAGVDQAPQKVLEEAFSGQYMHEPVHQHHTSGVPVTHYALQEHILDALRNGSYVTTGDDLIACLDGDIDGPNIFMSDGVTWDHAHTSKRKTSYALAMFYNTNLNKLSAKDKHLYMQATNSWIHAHVGVQRGTGSPLVEVETLQPSGCHSTSTYNNRANSNYFDIALLNSERDGTPLIDEYARVSGMVCEGGLKDLNEAEHCKFEFRKNSRNQWLMYREKHVLGKFLTNVYQNAAHAYCVGVMYLIIMHFDHSPIYKKVCEILGRLMYVVTLNEETVDANMLTKKQRDKITQIIGIDSAVFLRGVLNIDKKAMFKWRLRKSFETDLVAWLSQH